jgi:hypothetical protein
MCSRPIRRCWRSWARGRDALGLAGFAIAVRSASTPQSAKSRASGSRKRRCGSASSSASGQLVDDQDGQLVGGVVAEATWNVRPAESGIVSPGFQAEHGSS